MHSKKRHLQLLLEGVETQCWIPHASGSKFKVNGATTEQQQKCSTAINAELIMLSGKQMVSGRMEMAILPLV